MTSKVYRTGQGRMIDMGALILQNERVRAVGNMGVNARGDVLDTNNTVIDPKGNQVQRQYERQTQSVQPVPVSTPVQSPSVTTVHENVDPAEAAALKALDDEFNEDIDVRVAPQPVAQDPIVEATTGIAAAIKKANKAKTDNQ
jgi:hypothetical protein